MTDETEESGEDKKRREPTPHEDREEALDPREVVNYAGRFEVQPVELDSIPEDQLLDLLEDHRRKRLFDGGAIEGDLPTLAFRLRDPRAIPHAKTFFWPWVWPGFFGTSLTVSCMMRGAVPTSQARVWLPQGSKVAETILRTGRFRAVCVRRGAPEVAFEVTVPSSEDSEFSLAELEKSFQDAEPAVADQGAHYWETLEGNWTPQFGPEHLLSGSWMRAYRRRLGDLLLNLRAYKEGGGRIPDGLDEPLLSIFGIADDPSEVVASATKILGSAFESEQERERFWRQLSAISSPDLAWLPLEILSAYLWSSEVSMQGLRLPWIGDEDQSLKFVDLDAEALHAQGAAADYWERLYKLQGPLILDWGDLLVGSDAPVSPETLEKGVADVRASAPIAEVRSRTSEALRDAASLSPAKVVERAVVPLRCGPFATAEIVQTPGDVLVVWRTLDGEFAFFAADPATGNWATPDVRALAPSVEMPAVDQFVAEARLSIAETIRELRSVGDSALLTPAEWIASDAREEEKRFVSQRDCYRHSHWVMDGLRPSDLYAYFKARFGQPNGMMSVLRQEASTNLFHWQYNVVAGGDLLCVRSSTTRIECSAATKQSLSLGDQKLIAHAIKGDFQEHAGAIGKVRQEFEEWTLFSNPFATMARKIEEAETELSLLSLSRPPESLEFFLDEGLESGASRRRSWLRRMGLAFNLTVRLHTFAPIWGESFVNLLILVLGREDIREDSRLYGDVIRRPIDVRIRGLHISCEHFRERVDTECTAYKDFHSLMNERNDALHGNVDPQRLAVDRLYLDGTVPLFREQQSLASVVAQHSFRDVDSQRARRAVESVRTFVDHVLSCLEPKTRDHMRNLLFMNPLGLHPSSHTFRVMFESMAESVVGSSAPGQRGR